MQRFADWYTDTVFSVWTGTLGRLTSLVPFSVGEFLLIAALLWLFLFLLVLLHHILTMLITPLRKKHRARKHRHLRKRFYKTTAAVALIATVIMVLNCFIPYRCSPLTPHVRDRFPADPDFPDSEHTAGLAETEQLIVLRDYAVTLCNEMAAGYPRDEDGILLPEAIPADDAILRKAQESVASLSVAYPRLGAWQVRPKPLVFSGFVSQQYMQGYYFPFSMEACYNNLIVRTNLPFAVCHELAHTHGYLREDDCNFIGFLACLHSDDAFFRYSGWISVLAYLNRDVKRLVSEEEYMAHPAISEQVLSDARFLTPEVFAQVEQHALFRTGTVKKAADIYVDTTLKANGISSGSDNYSEVVSLLCAYFFD